MLPTQKTMGGTSVLYDPFVWQSQDTHKSVLGRTPIKNRGQQMNQETNRMEAKDRKEEERTTEL